MKGISSVCLDLRRVNLDVLERKGLVDFFLGPLRFLSSPLEQDPASPKDQIALVDLLRSSKDNGSLRRRSVSLAYHRIPICWQGLLRVYRLRDTHQYLGHLHL